MAKTFPGGYKKALTLSYDDGVEQDIRLMDILNRNGIKCSFNLNSRGFAEEATVYEPGTIHRRMSLSQALPIYSNSGHEVAFHGSKHLAWTGLSGSERDDEILADIKKLSADFKCEVKGGAYPYGAYDENTADYLRSIGVKYCRTVWSSENFDLPSDPIVLRPTCHHDDPRLFELLDDFLAYEGEEPILFYLWGHSYEFDEKNNWELIERFAQKAGGHKDIWYATNAEIIEALENIG